MTIDCSDIYDEETVDVKKIKKILTMKGTDTYGVLLFDTKMLAFLRRIKTYSGNFRIINLEVTKITVNIESTGEQSDETTTETSKELSVLRILPTDVSWPNTNIILVIPSGIDVVNLALCRPIIGFIGHSHVINFQSAGLRSSEDAPLVVDGGVRELYITDSPRCKHISLENSKTTVNSDVTQTTHSPANSLQSLYF